MYTQKAKHMRDMLEFNWIQRLHTNASISLNAMPIMLTEMNGSDLTTSRKNFQGYLTLNLKAVVPRPTMSALDCSFKRGQFKMQVDGF